MVSSQHEMSFADDGLYQFACKESCQVDCSSRGASFVEIPPYHGVPEKAHLADEEAEVFSQSQGDDSLVGSMSEMSVIAQQNPCIRKPESQCVSDLGGICSFRSVTSTSQDVGRSEHVKRPPNEVGLSQHPCKRARQVDHCDWRVSYEFSPLRTTSVEQPLSVAACKELRNSRAAFYEEPSRNASASTSSLSWFSCYAIEEHGSELPMSIYSSPCSTMDKGQSSRFIQLENVYLSMFDYYPRKHVAVGPDHQADIPAWRPLPIERPSKQTDPRVYSHPMPDEDDVQKFIGTCIIPMPDFTAVALDEAIAPVTRSGCSCLDVGSIRCVKQHVMQARDKLKATLGLGKFTQLGFYDMGEYVAQKWTEEEEQMFLEVVSANPASLGKNFWDHLCRVFPYKCSKELVSYYFNVFMLRKRAEQNRLDPLNIDSDNDEWQESDDGDAAIEDYESDSVVETPGDQDDVYNNDSHEEDDFRDEDDEDGDANDDFIGAEDHGHGLSRGQIPPKSSYAPRIPHGEVCVRSVAEDHDIQDDSCTSYEGQHIGANPAHDPAAEYSGMGKDHNRDVGLSSVMDPGCIVSPDAKVWDRSFFSLQERRLDFLPTCHVIEEVFGKGSWADQSEDGQGIS